MAWRCGTPPDEVDGDDEIASELARLREQLAQEEELGDAARERAQLLAVRRQNDALEEEVRALRALIQELQRSVQGLRQQLRQ